MNLNCGLPIFKGNKLLPTRIFSLKNFEFAHKEFAPLRIFCKFMFEKQVVYSFLEGIECP